ncbi:MAG: peptidase domain-containing ABC transporter [Candidatus Schmidhempelia sp.]|nr:peptidase domain-containing ABC transporter [Candidatus Schmidhempelia sp.]
MDNTLFQKLVDKLQLTWRIKLPQILQSESAECGLACLAMICHYYGLSIDLFNLRQQFGYSSKGASLAVIKVIAEAIGLKSRALSLDINELKELKLPCILHWNMSHFVVLAAVKKNTIIIHDPAFGRREISLQETSSAFTGIALELWPDKGFEKVTIKTRIKLKALFKSINGLPKALLKIFCLSVLIEVVNLLLPVGTQLVTDYAIEARDHSLLSLICLGLIFTLFFRTFTGIIRTWISIMLNTLVDIQWKNSLFDHLMRLPLSFFEKRSLGDIQSRFASLDVIKETFIHSIISVIIDCIMVFGLLIMMFLYGNWLLWVVIGFTIIYALIRIGTYRYNLTLSEEKIVKNAKSHSHFMETLYGMQTVKALGIANKRSMYWLNLNIDAANSNIKLTRFNMLIGGINSFLATIDEIIILWVGAILVIDNAMTLGMFFAFNAYRGQFTERASSLIDLGISFKMLSLHNERLSDIAFTEAEEEKAEKRFIKANIPVSIEIRNLSFQYDPVSLPVFEQLNLKIEAGSSVAIIGPSGVGKTTLLKVISGLLQPTKGEILVNGLEINKIGLNNYRQMIACVLQEDRLFSGSLFDNIAAFDQHIDHERVKKCAEHCNLDQEIMAMPMGYETLIGELGTGLSGGQKQRLLIARALYRRPNILFMDEATSHLDLDNESIINQSMRNLNITRIIIAHRPSTIASAERVILLPEGKEVIWENKKIIE